MVHLTPQSGYGGPGDDFLQSRFWAEFKTGFGWTAQRFKVESTILEHPFSLSVLSRRLAGPFCFAYVPHGPDDDTPEGVRQELLVQLAVALRPYLNWACLFLRYDSAWYGPQRPGFKAPLVKGSDVQPADSVVINLQADDEALLAAMKPKWRYNIRLADKKGVSVSEEGQDAIDVFYDLYVLTARRDRIVLHPKQYYAKLFELCAKYRSETPVADHGTGGKEPRPDLLLWVARHEGQALAAIMVLQYGRTATYLYGASSDTKRNLMPAYALQWAAMRNARDSACQVYDMYGIPPCDDPSHPMAGLYRFKTGFGGEIRHCAGAWDYPFRPWAYRGFRTLELVRLFWYKRLRKGHRDDAALPV